MKAFFGMKSPSGRRRLISKAWTRWSLQARSGRGNPPYVNEYLDLVSNGSGKPFHIIVEMGGRGDQSAIAIVRKRLEGKGMKFLSSASTIEKDVESGSFTGPSEPLQTVSGNDSPVKSGYREGHSVARSSGGYPRLPLKTMVTSPVDVPGFW